MKAASFRSRVRAQLTEEIKVVARRHLATDGANLSLRAVTRDLGMTSSAIYRYFASRDELLTALILDGYHSLGSAVEAAEAAVPREDLTGRWLAVCHGLRDWAVANPHEYALLYGSPVPGYQAPPDTVPAAQRAAGVLGRILQDGTLAGQLPGSADPPANQDDQLPEPVAAEIARIGQLLCPAAAPAVLCRAMGAWTQLFGTVTFELFGQFRNAIEDTRGYFDHQMRAQARQIGL